MEILLNKIILYFFYILIVFSSLMVVHIKNSVYAILYLILTFLGAVGLMLFLECEFFPFIFLMVYVGAIAVLFLFTIMMLDIKQKKYSFNDFFLIFAIFLSLFFLFELINGLLYYFLDNNVYYTSFLYNYYINWYVRIDFANELDNIGQVLYTKFVVQFLLIGLILLLGVVSAVILTLNMNKKNKKKQFIFKQLSRNYKYSIVSNY